MFLVKWIFTAFFFLLPPLSAIAVENRDSSSLCFNIEKNVSKAQEYFYKDFNFYPGINLLLTIYKQCKTELENNIPLYINLLSELTWAYRFSELEQSENIITINDFAISLSVEHFGKDSSIAANFMVHKAHILSQIGSYKAAMELQKQALVIRLAKDTPIPLDLARSYNDIGYLHRYMQNYSESLEYLKKALSIFEPILGRTNAEVAWVYNNLGNVLTNQNKMQEGMFMYEQALRIFEEVYPNSHPSLAGVNNNIGTVLHVEGRLDEVSLYYSAALEIYQRFYGQKHPKVALVYNNMGELALQQGKREKAKSYFNKSIDIRSKINNGFNPDLAWTYSYIGELYAYENIANEALSYFESSIEIWKKLAGTVPFDRLDTLRMAANMANISGNKPLAIKYYYQLIDYVIEHLTNHVFDADGFRNSKKDAVKHIRSTLQFLSQNSTSQVVLVDNLKWKLFQLISWNEVSIQNGLSLLQKSVNPESRKTDLLKLLREKDSLDRKFKQLVNQNEGNEKITSLVTQMSELNDLINGKIKELSFNKINIVEKVFPASLSLKDAQKRISKNQLISIYHVDEKSGFAIALTGSSIDVVPLSVNGNTIEKLSSDIFETLDMSKIERLSDIKAFAVDSAYKLYEYIVEPVISVNQNIEELFVISNNVIANIPFYILLTNPADKITRLSDFPKYENADWLYKKITVTRLASIFPDNSLNKTGHRKNDRVLMIGAPHLTKVNIASMRGEILELFNENGLAVAEKLMELGSLPNALLELNSAKVLGSNYESVTNEFATERFVKSTDLTKYKYLAIATHAAISSSEGGFKHGLVLTPPQTPSLLDDGFLSHSEIRELSLNADLVVLSGCNTASSVDGEIAGGLNGLASSFFYAGSNSVLASHWQVEDESTQKLMALFYKNISLGKNNSKSIRSAISEFIDNESKPYQKHPLFWGAFQLVNKNL